jgi:dTDP-4-dehydrorhamnose reductase
MSKRYKILITGSSGMLGLDLCQELRKDYVVEGADIVASARQCVKFYQSDITDRDNIAGIIADARPNIVVHTAAWTDVDGCEREKDKAYLVNATGAENVALACKAAGASLIYISTDFVFDGKKDRPYKETDKPAPLSVYGDSKLKGEESVRKALNNHFVLRTSWLYGKNGKNFVDTIIAKAATEKMLKVVDDQVGSPTYTKDLAKAIHKLLDRITIHDPERSLSARGRSAIYGIYHLSNAGKVSWYGYARTILKFAGSKTKVLPIDSNELARPAKRPEMSVLDNSKFTRLTGYKMRNWKTTLKEYLKEEGSLEGVKAC